MFAKDYVVLDLETTGSDILEDEIIEIGLVRISRGEIAEKKSWLIKPTRPLPKSIVVLTGITDKTLKGKPIISKIVNEVESFILGADLIGHNIKFTIDFLKMHFNLGAPRVHIDTLDLAKIILPSAINYTLENLVFELGIKTTRSHRAVDDAETTAQVFIRLFETALLANIDVLSAATKILQKHPGNSRFFNAVLKEKVKNTQVGTTRSFLEPLFLPLRSVRPQNENYQLDSEEIVSWLKGSSPLTKDNSEFEERPPQIEMTKAIVDSINLKINTVIEAGTGTGKSLAYLLPAANYASHSGNKVVIATNTISLQEQLLTKDIPQLEKLHIDVLSALFKGRSNYLCLRKLFLVDLNEDVSNDNALLFAKTYFWLQATKSGDKSELNISSKTRDFWRLVASDSESCLGNKCKWYAKNCYFWHAKRIAELADVLVINHALLLSDCHADRKILPDYKYLIIDEAHHLEKIASEHLGAVCDIWELNFMSERILSSNKTEGYSVLGKVRKYLLAYPEQERFVTNSLLEQINSLQEVIQGFKTVFNQMLTLLKNTLAIHIGNTTYQQTIRLKQSILSQNNWQEILGIGQETAQQLSLVARTLNKFILSLESIPNESSDKEQWHLEINNYMLYFRENAETLTVFFNVDLAQEIKWIEYDVDFKNTFLIKYVPFDIGSILKETLYDKCDSIIFTSATLTVEKQFDHYLDNVGLNLLQGRVKTLCLGTTFDYQKQVLVAIPTGIGNPQGNEEMFLNNTITFIQEICTKIKGHTLVLFTSHKQLRYVYENITLPEDVTLFAQNISGSRGKILQNFCLKEQACLLGANTFWEGIDLPGDLLNLLVIVKLPFLPPTYPLLEAKVEFAEVKGHNAFQKITLPGAIIRFKQGFGRLIRRKNDKGAVIILDNRITEKKYGLSFLRSLPIKTCIVDTNQEIISKVSDWIIN